MVDDKRVEKLLKVWGKEYKKGFMGYFILLLLKESEMYGLEINKKLADISESRMVLQESGIYQILKNLENHGMVSTAWHKSDKGPRRKYYTLEEPGERFVELFTRDYIIPILKTASHLVRRHFPVIVNDS